MIWKQFVAITVPIEFLAYLVSLWFERRHPKQNSVARQK